MMCLRKFSNHEAKLNDECAPFREGQTVWVLALEDILKTPDVADKNRGLLFDPPMLAYCGNRYQVASRLHKIILEETGKMIELKNTVVLDGVTCRAWGCPRANLHFWREIWLKRVDPVVSVKLPKART